MTWIIVILLGLFTYWIIRKQRLSLPTACGAFVMAAGILLNVYLKQAFSHSIIVESSILTLTSILIGFALSLMHEAIKGILYSRHLADSITSFASGTWVAAFSIVVITITRWLPSMRPLAILFYIVNGFLWCGFLILVCRNFLVLWRDPKKQALVNGVIFLSCVATQSVAMATATLFGTSVSFPILVFLVAIGSLFYLNSFIFLVSHLIKLNWKNLIEEWTNTNCIIHGALSITGLSGILTTTLSLTEISVIWLITAVLFVAVEGIELARLFQRIQHLGWKNGLFVYHSTQWARNFTCGMFLAFTLNLPWDQSDLSKYSLSILWKNVWDNVGLPFLFTLFAAQLGLMIYGFIRTKQRHQPIYQKLAHLKDL